MQTEEIALGRQLLLTFVAHDTYDVLALLAEWLSAIGTVGAVIVALWLAGRQNRVVAKVHVSVVNLVGRGQSFSGSPEYFQIAVTNSGLRDLVVAGLTWRLGVFSRERVVVVPTDPPLSPRLPHRLSPGDTAHFLFPVAMFAEHSVPTLRGVWRRRWYRAFFRPRLRAGIYVSTGEELLSKPDANVLSLIEGEDPTA